MAGCRYDNNIADCARSFALDPGSKPAMIYGRRLHISELCCPEGKTDGPHAFGLHGLTTAKTLYTYACTIIITAGTQ